MARERRNLSFPNAPRDSPGPTAYSPATGRGSDRHVHAVGKSIVSRSAWLNTRPDGSAPDLPPEVLAKLRPKGPSAPPPGRPSHDLFADVAKPVDFVIPMTDKGFRFGQASRKFELEAQFREYVSP
eukprot:EG_transcript_26024